MFVIYTDGRRARNQARARSTACRIDQLSDCEDHYHEQKYDGADYDPAHRLALRLHHRSVGLDSCFGPAHPQPGRPIGHQDLRGLRALALYFSRR